MTVTVTFRNSDTTTVNLAGTGDKKTIAKWLDTVRITGIYVEESTSIKWYPFIEIAKVEGTVAP